MTILFSMMVSLSITLLWLNHPMSMGLILILQTINLALIVGMTMNTFILAYILIIIMLSGALVLFIYMASIASNEKFQTPLKLLMLFLIINLMIYKSSDNMYFMENFTNLTSSNMNEIISLNKLFNLNISILTVMMMIYLLLTMIVVSSIASSSEGPLRMLIKYE